MNTTTYHLSRIHGLTTILYASVMLGLFLPGPVAAQESCVRLLTKRCEVCHYMTRVCQKVDKERKKKSWFGGSEGTWKRTIKNMVKQGAQLNKAEEKILIECLSKPTSEVLSLCKLNK